MILLDTHIAVWLVLDPGRLNDHERRVTEGRDLMVSVISLWELRIKWRALDARGIPKGPADPSVVRAGLAAIDIPVLPLTPEQGLASLRHPIPHKDPFDEILLIQAQELGAKLLTRDSRMIGHPLALTAQP